jgi:predicted DNA-binding transcriptional regulator AlpA
MCSPTSSRTAATFPTTGLVRLASILAPAGPIPTSRSNWWAGVKSGRFPKPTYSLGPRIPTWRAEDIHKLIDNGIAKEVTHV